MAGGLDFEKPILELELKIAELKSLASDGSIDLSEEIKTLEARLEKVRKEIFESLTPWQKVQIARHPKRPYAMDYIHMVMLDFIELHGDRMFHDDKAIVGGFAKIDEEKVLVLGHQKGRDTKENLIRNFGSAHPEGYRKAMRLMKLAEKFNVPMVVFIDTPGAYPGIGAEERGQANSIAHNLREMITLKVPIIVVVIGEGGSGGALGIGIGDRVYVMENAYYSVISPEGCAAILWKDRLKAPEAAEVLKLTAKDLLGLGIIDGEIPEPLGGAHRDPEEAAQSIKRCIKKALKELKKLSIESLLESRYEKFRRMGTV
jgi:acetyl-CoA carboxylase carboxyl transferase subunit alpha